MTAEKLFKISSTGKWTHGLHTEVKVRDFAPMIVDEPKSFGGTNEAANPLEYLLTGLTGCTSVMIALISKELDFSYSAVEFSNNGTLDLRGLAGDPTVSAHFQTVSYEVHITTAESDEKLAALIDAVEKRCPILNLIKDAGVKVDSQWIKN